MAQLPTPNGRYAVVSRLATGEPAPADIAPPVSERGPQVALSPAAPAVADLCAGLDVAPERVAPRTLPAEAVRAAAPATPKTWERSVFNARETLRRARTIRRAAVPDAGERVSQAPSGRAIDLTFDEPRRAIGSVTGASPVPRWFSRGVTAAAAVVALWALALVLDGLPGAPSRAGKPGRAPTTGALAAGPPQMAAPPRAGAPGAMAATGWRSVHVRTMPAGAHASLGGATCTTPCTLLVGDADVPRPLTLERAGFDPFVEQVVVDGDLHVLVGLRPRAPTPHERPEAP